MKNILIILLGISLFPILNSCGVFFEKNIEDEPIKLLAPPNNLQTTQSNIDFWWEEVEQAETYEFQLVSPRFNQILSLVMDTTISTNKLSLHLNPGEYEWRVRAENAGSATEYSRRSFIVSQADSLNQEQLFLSSPDELAILNSSPVVFKWQSINNAADYRFEIYDENQTLVIPALLVTEDSTSISLQDGVYNWRVRAENGVSVSAWSERLFELDLTAPGTPLNLSPAQNDSLTNGIILFTWDYPVQSETDVKDSIYIYSDSLSTLLFKLESSTQFSQSNLNSGTYYWRVRSIDAANNLGNYSSAIRFEVQ